MLVFYCIKYADIEKIKYASMHTHYLHTTCMLDFRVSDCLSCFIFSISFVHALSIIIDLYTSMYIQHRKRYNSVFQCVFHAFHCLKDIYKSMELAWITLILFFPCHSMLFPCFIDISMSMEIAWKALILFFHAIPCFFHALQIFP